MHHTSTNHGHAATLEDTTRLAIYQPTVQKRHTSNPHEKDQSTQNAEYWDAWWLFLPTQKLWGFSTMGKQLHPYTLISKDSVFPDHQPQSKQITPLLKVSLPLLSEKSHKAKDVIFYWVEGQLEKNYIFVYWKPGIQNMGDCLTKKHPRHDHKEIWSPYVYMESEKLKLNHTVVQVWEDSIPKLNPKFV